MIRVGDVVWLCDYFEKGYKELGEIKRLNPEDRNSPLVIYGICQHTPFLLYTRFNVDISQLDFSECFIENRKAVFYATPKTP